jgi:hypothetical protein
MSIRAKVLRLFLALAAGLLVLAVAMVSGPALDPVWRSS